MVRKEPTRRGHNRDADIINAAIIVFCERGYAGASLQDVADRVGILKGSLFHYFESKEHLLALILDHAHEQVVQAFETIRALDVTPMERLRIFLEQHLTWYLENIELAKVTFHEWKNLTGETLAGQTERRRGYDKFVRDLLVDCQKSGDISRDAQLAFAANYLLGAINSVPDWYRRDGRDPPAIIAKAYTDLTIAMLRAMPPAPGPAVAHSARVRARFS